MMLLLAAAAMVVTQAAISYAAFRALHVAREVRRSLDDQLVAFASLSTRPRLPTSPVRWSGKIPDTREFLPQDRIRAIVREEIQRDQDACPPLGELLA